VIKRGSNCN